MKGLLIKDFCLLLGQRNYLISAVFFGFFLSFLNGGEFGSVYVVFMLSYFTLSTIVYDDYDNGMAFLMTLPVSRKGYVTEKYLLQAILSLGGGALGFLIRLLVTCVQEGGVTMGILGELSEFYFAFLLVIFTFLSINIALYVKFGSEKARMAFIGVLGIYGAFVFLWVKADDIPTLDRMVHTVSQWLRENEVLFLILFVLGAGLIVGISYLAAVRAMEKKEY